jgi:hypothetical protein
LNKKLSKRRQEEMFYALISIYMLAIATVICVIKVIKVEKTNAFVVKAAIIAVTVISVAIVAGVLVNESINVNTSHVGHIQESSGAIGERLVNENAITATFIVAFAAIFGAVFGGIVSLVIGGIKDKQSKNELYAKTVSSFRMDWIIAMREHIVDLIVLCKTINNSGTNENKKENSENEFERCRANILMRLNPNPNKETSNNEDLKKLLRKIKFEQNQICINGKITEKDIEDIERIGTNLLKEEWERVKVEAGETIKKREEIDLRTKEIKRYKESGHSAN